MYNYFYLYYTCQTNIDDSKIGVVPILVKSFETEYIKGWESLKTYTEFSFVKFYSFAIWLTVNDALYPYLYYVHMEKCFCWFILLTKTQHDRKLFRNMYILVDSDLTNKIPFNRAPYLGIIKYIIILFIFLNPNN